MGLRLAAPAIVDDGGTEVGGDCKCFSSRYIAVATEVLEDWCGTAGAHTTGTNLVVANGG